MELFTQEFPFGEIRDQNGDYFNTAQDVMNAGHSITQVWSVSSEGDYFTYGPHHHYINVIGFIATKEHHDGETYYEERVYDE